MCVTDCHDMTLAVKVVLNPNTANQNVTRPFCWYLVQGHLSRSRLNIKATIFEKWPLWGISVLQTHLFFLKLPVSCQSAGGGIKSHSLIAEVISFLFALKCSFVSIYFHIWKSYTVSVSLFCIF